MLRELLAKLAEEVLPPPKGAPPTFHVLTLACDDDVQLDDWGAEVFHVGAACNAAAGEDLSFYLWLQAEVEKRGTIAT